MTRGRFITIEGGEGAGKSTQAKRLCDAVRASGLAVVCTREPGGSPGAEEIRQLVVSGEPARWDAMTEALLHCAARRDHLAPSASGLNVKVMLADRGRPLVDVASISSMPESPMLVDAVEVRIVDAAAISAGFLMSTSNSDTTS